MPSPRPPPPRGLAQLLTLLVLLAAARPAAALNRASLDLGWRFQPNEPACAADAFPVPMDNTQCMGLQQAGTAQSEEDCKRLCCNAPACETYQWCPAGAACSPAQSCWLGRRDSCQPNRPGWRSAGRNATAGLNCTSPYCRPDYDDGAWRQLDVPHDFVVEGTFTPSADQSHGFLPKGTGWYRKHLTVPAALRGRRLWVAFDGVYRNSAAWLNGVGLGTHASGYTSFRFELPAAAVNYGADNVLAVHVDATASEGWWYEGGGIYRHVWFEDADAVHIDPWGLFAPTTAISGIAADGRSAASATVTVQTNVTNTDSAAQTVTLETTLLDAAGQRVARASSTQAVAAGAVYEFVQPLAVTSPALWIPGHPALYTLVSAVAVGGAARDALNTTIGLRQVVFDVDRGLFVNGQPIKVRGLCNHQDFAGLGTALPDRVNEFRVRKLQEMGANAWRMSHNPPNPELLGFTDRLGMLVWNENRNFDGSPAAQEDVARLVLRDRNHPSVILWSLCNEGGCMEGANDDAALQVARTLYGIIKSHDPHRKISAAWNAGTQDLDYGWGPKVLDVQGINYNYGEIDQFHQLYPNLPMISSETASCTCARGIYQANNSAAHKDVYSADGCAHEWLAADETRAFMAGGFAWTGFDYKGEPTPYGWPCVNSNFGILDLAGFPKDTFYFYQSWWQSAPVLHVLPHWNYPAQQVLNAAFATACDPTDPFQRIAWDAVDQQLKTHDGFCVDAACLNVSVGCEPLLAVPCGSFESQKFVHDAARGTFRNVENGGCIDLWNGGAGPSVGIYSCDGGSNQAWWVDAANTRVHSNATGDRCLGTGRITPVWAYTNLPEVELFVNGVSRGRRTTPSLGHVEWNVEYTPGNIEAHGYNRDGSVALTVRIESTSDPVALVLEQEFPASAIVADSQDVALVTVYAVDRAGRRVPTAANEITFTASGPGRVIGVGNGDPSDHYPDKGVKRLLFNGLARAIVQATAVPGAIVVGATSPGLSAANVTIQSVPPAAPLPRM